MSEKECTKCGEVKAFSEFGKLNRSKDGFRSECNCCRKRYNNENKEKIKASRRRHYLENKEKINQKNKDWHYANKEKANANCREYNKKNKKELQAYNKEYYLKNKEKAKADRKAYYQKNKEKCLAGTRAYREKNLDRVRAVDLAGKKRRRKTDPAFKILCLLRRRVLYAIKGTDKSAPTMELLGCTAEHAKQHLENQFTEGMTWNNHGFHGWHVDHIMPCASFDMTDPEQQKECFHYTNLQPLWAKDNLIKGDRILNQ